AHGLHHPLLRRARTRTLSFLGWVRVFWAKKHVHVVTARQMELRAVIHRHHVHAQLAASSLGEDARPPIQAPDALAEGYLLNGHQLVIFGEQQGALRKAIAAREAGLLLLAVSQRQVGPSDAFHAPLVVHVGVLLFERIKERLGPCKVAAGAPRIDQLVSGPRHHIFVEPPFADRLRYLTQRGQDALVTHRMRAQLLAAQLDHPIPARHCTLAAGAGTALVAGAGAALAGGAAEAALAAFLRL